MNIITKQLNISADSINLDRFGNAEDILFIDIETTGFTATSSSLYLIGCAYKDGLMFTCKQFFAEKTSEESRILEEFLSFASRFKILVHFNGNNFDVPYIQDKCEKYGLECHVSDMVGIDLYKRISPLKTFLKLPNVKQKTLEQYLHVTRRDTCSGKDLINVYHDYLNLFSVDALSRLITHNEEDLQGMIRICPMLSYSDLFTGKIVVSKVDMDRYVDNEGTQRCELVMKLKLPNPLPQETTSVDYGYYFKGEGDVGILKVPVFDCELKYFYANYRDYYYLPVEDEALHKSVASFVDRDHRVQATAATCYTKVHSLFLQQWEPLFLPLYKIDYHSQNLFLEITDERKKDREFFSEYASYVLNHISR